MTTTIKYPAANLTQTVDGNKGVQPVQNALSEVYPEIMSASVDVTYDAEQNKTITFFKKGGGLGF